MELTRLHEDLKLTTGRLNTSTGQAADLLQQLKSVQAENASLMSQLALSQGRDTEAAAAHKALQEALDSMRSELKRWVGPAVGGLHRTQRHHQLGLAGAAASLMASSALEDL